MTFDDTEAVAARFGKVTPVDAEDVQRVVNDYPRLRQGFQDGDTLYRWSTVSFLAGRFGFLLARGREIMVVQNVGMS